MATIAEKVAQIEKEFKSGQLKYIDAIDDLIRLGYSPKKAESWVCDWEEEIGEV